MIWLKKWWHYKEVSKNLIWSWNGQNLYRSKRPRLNSVLRYEVSPNKFVHKANMRFYSQDSYIDRIDVSNKNFWPINPIEIEEVVIRKQIELAKIAEEHGRDSSKVHRMQEI